LFFKKVKIKKLHHSEADKEAAQAQCAVRVNFPNNRSIQTSPPSLLDQITTATMEEPHNPVHPRQHGAVGGPVEVPMDSDGEVVTCVFLMDSIAEVSTYGMATGF
jgi:hypothetical protein